MPIYEYHCGDCESRFEVLVMGSNPEPTACDCGSPSIEKVYSTFSAQTANGAPDVCATPAEERCDGPVCMSGMCGMN